VTSGRVPDVGRLHALLAGGGPDEALAELAAHPPDTAARVLDDGLARALVATLDRASRGEQRRAADALASLAPHSTPLRAALEDALRAPGQRLRWGAAYTLGRAQLAGSTAWPAAREAMALDDGDQRWAAAELACAIVRRHPEVQEQLRAALGDPSATLRKMALYCLRDIRSKDTPGAALAALHDADAGVRLAAVSAAGAAARGSHDAAAGAAALASLLADDPDAGVRRAAAAALGKLGAVGDDVVRRLEEAARSADASLARAAQNALRTLRGAG